MATGPYTTPAYPITIPIPLSLNSVELVFWMRPFTVDTLLKRYRINNPNATLYLQKLVPYKEAQAMGETDRRALSYSISPYNFEEVKELFQCGLEWLSEEGKNELFGHNEEGILIFNGEYQKLKAVHSDEYSGVRTALQLSPTIIEVAHRIYAPGIVLYVNKKDNAVILREYEFRRLANFIVQFSFTGYIQFAMECMRYSFETGQVLSYEQVQARLRAQREYNTNL